jgi:hypothetical protein
VKEFDYIRYRRIKKILNSQEEQTNTNINQSSEMIDTDNTANIQNEIIVNSFRIKYIYFLLRLFLRMIQY